MTTPRSRNLNADQFILEREARNKQIERELEKDRDSRQREGCRREKLLTERGEKFEEEKEKESEDTGVKEPTEMEK